MTEQHPLTDDKCFEIWSRNLYENEWMRAAADWQLKQVIEWMRDNLQDHRYSGIGIDVDYVIEALAQDMRPQQQEDNQ